MYTVVSKFQLLLIEFSVYDHSTDSRAIVVVVFTRNVWIMFVNVQTG